jgi:hypothetical protein
MMSWCNADYIYPSLCLCKAGMYYPIRLIRKEIAVTKFVRSSLHGAHKGIMRVETPLPKGINLDVLVAIGVVVITLAVLIGSCLGGVL